MYNESEDDDLAILMMELDKEALREVLRRYLEPTREILEGKYGNTVQQCDIDAAVNRAAMKLWEKAGDFDRSKGSIGSWFYTMAQSAVIDVYRREKRHRTRHPILPDGYDVADDCEENLAELTKAEKKELEALDHIIEDKLPPLQKAIIKADLVVGGTADAGSLAELHNTSKNSIYVSRNRARETICREMTKIAQERERLRGKK